MLQRLIDAVQALDRWLRYTDLWLNRTHGGVLRRINVSRHTLVTVLLPSLLVFFVVNGPALRPSMRLGLGVAAMLVSGALFAGLLWLGDRRASSIARDFLLQAGTLSAIGAVVWYFAGDAARERSDTLLYQHVLIPMSALVGLATLIGMALARGLFGSSRGRELIPPRLSQVELFVRRPAPAPVTLSMIGLAAFGAITSSPGRVLLPPALLALFVEREWVLPVAIAALALNLLLLAFAGLDRRFSASWYILHRVFFDGWSSLVSAVVIALGVARMFDVQYVSTVFDGARNYTLGGYLLVAYTLAWWHDYWTSTAAAIRVLDLIGGRGGADDARIDYELTNLNVQSTVPAAGRLIQTHGGGRLLIFHPGRLKPFFHAYTPSELIGALADDAVSATPLRTDLDWVAWRLNAHFLVTAAIVVALFGGVGWWLHGKPQHAHIPAPGGKYASVAPASVVFPADVCSGQSPVIALAASGGGTRAALYTASILERLQKAGQLGHVRLVSGVSGGGAALAYFAAHRRQLLAGTRAEWDDFFDAMKDPYIEDVIDGSGEWRIATGSRLGRLLAESFERNWGAGKTLGDITDVGFILNSSVAGRFQRPKGRMESLAELEREVGRGLSDVAGGRAVYTNLSVPPHFDNPFLIDGNKGRETRDTRLPVFIVNGADVKLSDAAAANANFPPVFSNAPVDLPDVRLWITDGGAIDNRGTETLLMAIRYAMTKGLDCPTLPPLHIVEVEASAFSDGYSQDRGVGSMMSAGTAFASQLDAELLAQLRTLYQQRGKDADAVRFHYLPMPALLRRSGSFGTHWMMQERVTVCPDLKCKDEIVLTADEVLAVLRTLDQSSVKADDSSQADEVHERIVKEEQRNEEEAEQNGETWPTWDSLAACLRAPGGACP
jgi:hypothetical protein